MAVCLSGNEISSLCSDISNPLAGEALSRGPLSG